MEQKHITPKDFFLHIASIITLYISASSLLVLLFQIINISFPDAISPSFYYYDPYNGMIRAAIASLIVVFPLYLYITSYLNKGYEAEPAKRNMGLRRWLVYLTLFIAGAVIAGDVIFLINNFLGGETSARFVLKCIAVLAVAALVFGYYLRDLRSEGALPFKERLGFRYGAMGLVVLSIVGGFVIMGSPKTQRLIKFDNEKIQNLQNIQWQLVNHWQTYQKLPDNLAGLTDSISGYKAPLDTQSGIPFEYTKTGTATFRLCANFNLPTPKVGMTPQGGIERSEIYDLGSDNWQHSPGRVCFDRTIDPVRYPPIQNMR